MPRLRQPQNFYAGNEFDRLAERRKDANWVRTVLASGQAVVLPMWQGRSLITGDDLAPQLMWLEQHQLSLPIESRQLVLLGEFRGRYCFAVGFEGEEPPPITEHGRFLDLRTVGGMMDRHEAGLLGYARALLMWQVRHQFCGRCGEPTRPENAGHVLKCSNERCGLSHFPRLDPAVIVLVTDGERILLGRQAQWPAGRYSTIAGFVEWAESLEEAVAREVLEETGVVVDEVEYQSSQPWPFPSSLMLGFIAHAITTHVERRDGELEDARWFSRQDIRDGALTLPPVQALSFSLIETWYDSASVRPLREESGASIARFAQPARG